MTKSTERLNMKEKKEIKLNRLFIGWIIVAMIIFIVALYGGLYLEIKFGIEWLGSLLLWIGNIWFFGGAIVIIYLEKKQKE